MTRDDLGYLALGATLTTVAGCVDAIGFLRLGHLFVSFMSGNSTQLAVELAHGRWTETGSIAGVIGLFVAGVAMGRLLSGAAGAWRRPAVLFVVALLLAGALASARDLALSTACLVLAMGVQNAALHKAGGVKTSLTYVTGTLVNLGEALADALAGPRWGWAPYALMWIGLVCGSALGAFAYQAFGMTAVLIPAATLALLGVLTGGLVVHASRKEATR